VPPERRARCVVEPDRATAIHRAIAEAAEGDVVLIAGKGHETYQIFADRTIHFSDQEVAEKSLAGRSGPSN
jgi:UDP-N-acetylmuramoyl-L-alanyl-D-glutamate--2,6-diaminopimelate ligase